MDGRLAFARGVAASPALSISSAGTPLPAGHQVDVVGVSRRHADPSALGWAILPAPPSLDPTRARAARLVSGDGSVSSSSEPHGLAPSSCSLTGGGRLSAPSYARPRGLSLMGRAIHSARAASSSPLVTVKAEQCPDDGSSPAGSSLVHADGAASSDVPSFPRRGRHVAARANVGKRESVVPHKRAKPSGGARPAPLAPLPSGSAFKLNVGAFKRSRKGARLTAAEKAEQHSFADIQDYKKLKAARWLASCVPPALRDWMLGGELAVRQTPDEAQRDAAFEQQLLLRASTEGAACGQVRRALQKLAEFSPDDHLPAGRLLVNRCITAGAIQALDKATGSQGGATVAASLRSGFLSAQMMGFPVEADSILVDAAAPPAKKRRRENRAGSLPIKWYAQFEVAAASWPRGPRRLILRQLLLCWMMARLRFVDVMRATVSLKRVLPDGAVVVQIVTSFSKDGAPIDVYFKAEGFLGPFEWILEHLEDVSSFDGFAIPAFKCEKKRAGKLEFATELHSPARSAPKEHGIDALRFSTLVACGATEAVWKALFIKPHSAHGSASDMAAVIGPHAPPDVCMCDVDERELGHWRRLAAAMQGDGDLVLDPLITEAINHAAAVAAAPAGSAAARMAPPAMAAQDAEMRVRYTSGTNREGRTRAQVRVHLRWVTAVRRAIAHLGGWELLKGDRSDYDILENIPPLAVTEAARSSGSDEE